MTRWSKIQSDTEDELKAADALLHKADAFLRRHRGPEAASEEEFVPLEDDLPVLDDVVEGSEPAPPLLSDAVTPGAAVEPGRTEAMNEVLERLVNLDTEIARIVEAWFAEELPQLLSRELDKLSVRLREEAVAHLRATLLPELSERISRSLSASDERPHKR